MLASIILGKPKPVQENMDAKMMSLSMQRLAKVVDQLIEQPESIDKIEVLLASGVPLVNKRKLSAAEENSSEEFPPQQVKTVGDIPIAWLVAWFQMASKKPPDANLIESMNPNAVKLKQIRLLATGIPDNMPLCPELLHKDTLAAFLLQQHAKCNHILDNGEGFWTEAVIDGKPVFKNKHGCYEFLPHEDQADEIHSVMHNPSGNTIVLTDVWPGVSLKFPLEIDMNNDDWKASVKLMGRVHPLCSLFGASLQKPNKPQMKAMVESFVKKYNTEKLSKHVQLDQATINACKRKRKAPATAPATPLALTLG